MKQKTSGKFSAKLIKKHCHLRQFFFFSFYGVALSSREDLNLPAVSRYPLWKQSYLSFPLTTRQHFPQLFQWILLSYLLSSGPSTNMWLEILEWLLRDAEVGNVWGVFRRLHCCVRAAYGDQTYFVPQPRRGVAFWDRSDYFSAL